MIGVYKENVISSLKYLADYEFQKVAWFSTGEYPVSSFIEDVCQLFDDTGLGEALDIHEPIFGEPADTALHELSKLVDGIDETVDDSIIIDSPAMQAVRQKALEALSLILK